MFGSAGTMRRLRKLHFQGAQYETAGVIAALAQRESNGGSYGNEAFCFGVHGALAPPLSCYSRHYCASIHMHSESFAAIRRPEATHKRSPYQLRTSIDKDLCSGVIAWLLAAIDSVKLLNFHSKGWEHIVAALSCAPLLNYAVL